MNKNANVFDQIFRMDTVFVVIANYTHVQEQNRYFSIRLNWKSDGHE